MHPEGLVLMVSLSVNCTCITLGHCFVIPLHKHCTLIKSTIVYPNQATKYFCINKEQAGERWPDGIRLLSSEMSFTLFSRWFNASRSTSSKYLHFTRCWSMYLFWSAVFNAKLELLSENWLIQERCLPKRACQSNTMSDLKGLRAPMQRWRLPSAMICSVL